MTQDQQRLTSEQRPQQFGALGLRGDHSVRNGIFWTSLIVAYFSVVASLSARPDERVLGIAWGAAALVLAIANFFLPSYEGLGARWWTRIFGSGFPMLGVLVIVYARWVDPAGFAEAIGRS